MDEDQLKEYLDELVRCHDLHSEVDFADFLKLNPSVVRKITCSSNDVFWLYFERHTFDGWYCIRHPRFPIYYVYFQERGRMPFGDTEFKTKDYEEAVARVLICHGVLKF
jgi:hypothetical protein